MLKEDAEFLEQLESDLSHRYTESDKDYRQTCDNPAPNPPILKIVVERRPSYYEDDFYRNSRRGRHDYHQRKQNSYHPYRRNNSRFDRNATHSDGQRQKFNDEYKRNQYKNNEESSYNK